MLSYPYQRNWIQLMRTALKFHTKIILPFLKIVRSVLSRKVNIISHLAIKKLQGVFETPVQTLETRKFEVDKEIYDLKENLFNLLESSKNSIN